MVACWTKPLARLFCSFPQTILYPGLLYQHLLQRFVKLTEVCSLILETFLSMLNFHYLAQLLNRNLSSFLRYQDIFEILEICYRLKSVDLSANSLNSFKKYIILTVNPKIQKNVNRTFGQV